ncbi:MAG: alpha-2-macroglobulin [Candidatus Xenobiia bacterium LiM19]
MRRYLSFLGILTIFLLVMHTAGFCYQSTRKLWDNVSHAVAKGLPQTAIDNLKLIHKTALAEGRKGEALKALTIQIVLESSIKGNKPEYKVKRLREEIAKADEGMKPVMKALLAQWYWHYYSQNRYRFLNRTATEGVNDDDFTTWDLRKIFKEISSIYQDLLKNEESLKKMSITEFKDILDMGNTSLHLRPTLFDFVAWKALEFYSRGEQAGARPEDAFEIDAGGGAFDDAASFLRYSPPTTDKESCRYQALRIYQRLMSFHQGDPDKDAFIDADLSRLNYVFNNSVGDQKTDIYIKRIKEIINSYPQSDLSSLALYYLAYRCQNQYQNKNNLIEAFTAAEKGKSAHPGSYGASLCESLLNNILQKSIELKGERLVPAGRKSSLLVTYRNLDSLTFRVVRDNWKEYLTKKGSRYYNFQLDDEKIGQLISEKPEAEWTVRLKPTTDYQKRQSVVTLPALKPGFHRVFASYKKDFDRKGNCLMHCTLWVSNIGVVTRLSRDAVEGFVVDNESGNPLPQANVTLYGLKDYNAPGFNVVQALKTDENGLFSFNGTAKSNYSRLKLAVSDGKGSEYVDSNDLNQYRPVEEKIFRSTLFFTDRAIYRPGQTIHFKGIVIEADRKLQNYKVLPGEKVTVRFRDVNRQEIGNTEVTSNDFGSFSGTFTAPADRLMGVMYLQTDTPSGTCPLRVEEYKRPKFNVELSPPKEGFRLNDEISVSGKAESYAGAAIDGAKVTWRVVREVRFPWWWSFFRGGSPAASQEISHGAAATDAGGAFTVKFNAKPDLSVPREGEPVFSYRIYADVTDSSGETRSDSTSVSVGYASMEAALSAENWQISDLPVRLSISTATLSGVNIPSSGSVEIFSLKEPSRIGRSEVTDGAEIEEGITDAAMTEGESSPNMNQWPLGRAVEKKSYQYDGKTSCSLDFTLKAGAYRAKLTTQDRFGARVTALLPIAVCDMKSSKFDIRVPSYYVVKDESVEVGDTFRALWGTGCESGRAFVEIYQNDKPVKKYWTGTGKTQALIDFPVTEAFRGGFTIITTSVRQNRMYSFRKDIAVPWPTKHLDLSLETFRSKVTPGAKEVWTLKVKGPGAEKKASEIVAALYDESLDAFIKHTWKSPDYIFSHNYSMVEERFSDGFQDFSQCYADWRTYITVKRAVYPDFISEITANLFGYQYMQFYKSAVRLEHRDGGGKRVTGGTDEGIYDGRPTFADVTESKTGKADTRQKELDAIPAAPPPGEKQAKDLSSVKARKNLNETAFFFPHLLTDKDGTVKISFTMPEALTKWHLLALAHGKGLESGFVEGHAVTQKDLMVQPNPPRFLREGDLLEFTVKVTNMTEKDINGAVRLSLFSPLNDSSIDEKLGNTGTDKEISIPPKQSRSFSWRLSLPDGLKMVGYRAVASAGSEKDGEEGVIPVISRRILVQEAIPLWVRGPGERKFTFKKLAESARSSTLVNDSYTVQITSNPAWYAVQALPFLMEFPHECSEQVFNRFYANTLARHIAGSDPKIRTIFDQWKNEQPDALLSNLEKNEELRNVMMLETPWVLDAKSESAAKKKMGALFDEARMTKELNSAFSKLKNMQLNDGSWPWFPGGRGNSFITLYIVTGFGRLSHLKAGAGSNECALRGVAHLDQWICDYYQEIKKHDHLNENNLSTTVALYLYGRSFFLKERPIPATSKEAVDYFLSQASRFWLKLNSRMGQGHLALALNRFGSSGKARDIMASIRERSQTDEELGMFWGETELSWWWYRAPIETQALMIEAFDEVMNDQKAVEECKVWLLKQKQTQDWKTTKATADAVYGLLCRGENLLSLSTPAEITIGGVKVEPDKVEAGTGFYEKRYSGAEVKPDFSSIVVKKSEKGIAWGGAHWQYMEDIGKVTPHTQNQLTLKKTVFLQKNEKSGPVIEPVKGALEVGDLIKVRIELQVDRDMEYVHMKDSRGSGLEPINVLSRYKYQDGLMYYESTRDTATHFYIDYLPKGTYVFEYPLRVCHKGKYQNGLAEIECMYAPEFNSHSDSVMLEVQ